VTGVPSSSNPWRFGGSSRRALIGRLLETKEGSPVEEHLLEDFFQDLRVSIRKSKPTGTTGVCRVRTTSRGVIPNLIHRL
jgi:hypothetical protein